MFLVQLFVVAFFVFMIVSSWKVFTKAGQPGWACFVPIYNIFVMVQIAKKPTWWVLLYFIPLVDIVVQILVVLETGKLFGKDTLWSIFLLVLFPFIGYPILAFGDAVYDGGSNNSSGQTPISPMPPVEPVNPMQTPPSQDASTQISPIEAVVPETTPEVSEQMSQEPSPLEQIASNQLPSEPVQDLGAEDQLQMPPASDLQTEAQSPSASVSPEQQPPIQAQADQAPVNPTPPATPPVPPVA